MAASLTRNARIGKLVPVAVAQGWGIRRFAQEARISYAKAGETLRAVRQRAETGFDELGASLCAASAREIRGKVGSAVSWLVQRVEAAMGDLDQEVNAAGLERLAGALETALRVADGLDGLSHVRAMETALVKHSDADAVRGMLSDVEREEGERRMSASGWLKDRNRTGTGSNLQRRLLQRAATLNTIDANAVSTNLPYE